MNSLSNTFMKKLAFQGKSPYLTRVCTAASTSLLPLATGECIILFIRNRVQLGSLSLLDLSLRPIDVEFMKRLDKCTNILPVIAKSDTLTLEERDSFKKRVCTILHDLACTLVTV